ncbi:MAG: response regulator [Anaerolineae bacterium]|nr:response regulator [Anaerolineae bacterium]
MVNNPKERILVVESDPFQRDQISHHILEANGYPTQAVADVDSAITRVLQWAPDLMIINLNLSVLSGKDLIVALKAQGVEIPLVVMAAKGLENDVIQAFRLGAADYLMIPAREAEIISVVERVTRQISERRERERLSEELYQTNRQLQARIAEQNTLFAVGKAVTSITDQSLLFEKILESAARLTRADLGWLLLREDVKQPFYLAAQRALPASLAQYINQPWDDGVSSLVAMSGEALSIHGEALRRFKISSLGEAAQIVPVKVQKQVIGLLCVMRKKGQAFGETEKNLLDALSDYASISLVNARLFRAVEQRAQSLQAQVEQAQSGRQPGSDEQTFRLREDLAIWCETSRVALERLAKAPGGFLSEAQKKEMVILRNQFHQLGEMIDVLRFSRSDSAPAVKPLKK